VKVPSPADNKKSPIRKEELEKLREELSRARETIVRDRRRIRQLNARISQLAESSYVYPGKSRRIETWMGRLEHDFKVLLESKRWRIGNTLVNICRGDFAGKNQPGAILDAQKAFAEFAAWRERYREDSRLSAARKQPYRVPVEEMIDQLDQDVSALARSTRYRMGDSLARAWSRLLLRRSEPELALARMQGLIMEYREAREQEKGFSPEQVVKLISDFEILLSGLEASSRWRIGGLLAGTANNLLLRRKSLTAADHVRALLADFRRGKYFVSGLDDESLDLNRLTRPPGKDLFGKTAVRPYKIRKP